MLRWTTESAKDILQDSLNIDLQDDGNQAPQNTGTVLDKRFAIKHKPVQKSLLSLLKGPTIEKRNINALFLLAHDCNVAAQQ